MKSLLIATDFSKPATNAARYAVELCTYLHIETLVIYHSYRDESKIVSGLPLNDDQASPLERDTSLKQLEILRESLQQTALPLISIKIETNNKSLLLGIEQMAIQYQAQLVVLGTTGKSYLEEIFVGSNALYLAKKSSLPLLLIPEVATFKSLKNAILATDLKHIEKNIPINSLRNFIAEMNLSLMVLNVSTPEDDFVADIIPEQYKLHDLLEAVHPTYHYITHKDIGEAITNFAMENQADLLIAVPKSRGFLEHFFHKSVTKKLAFHSQIPLLLLHP